MQIKSTAVFGVGNELKGIMLMKVYLSETVQFGHTFGSFHHIFHQKILVGENCRFTIVSLQARYAATQC